MDITDIYRLLPHRITESLDRMADSLVPDVPPTGNRLCDALERIAGFYGGTIHHTGNRVADAIDAIADVVADGLKHSAATAADLESLMNGDEARFVAQLSSDLDLGAEAVVVPEGKKATLDLEGHTISGSSVLLEVDGGEAVIKNGTVSSQGRPIFVRNGGKLTLDNATVESANDCAVTLKGEGASLTMNGGEVKAQEFGVLLAKDSEFVMNGGTVSATDNAAIGGNGLASEGNTVITINGGTLIGHIKTEGYIACGIYHPNRGTLNFNGGEIISDGCGICMRGGQVNINGGRIVAKGKSGVVGKVGDSRVVVGPYAVVYDQSAQYPAKDTMELNIARGVSLIGTDGDIQVLLTEGAEANIRDLR